MNRFTSLALAAVLAPAFTFGVGSVLAGNPDADANNQTRPTEQSGMNADEDLEESRTHARYDEADEASDHLTGKPENGYSADDLIGQKVRHREADQDMGTVKDLLIDQDGNVVALVVGTGGQLGIGEKNIAVNWNQIERSSDGDGMSLFIDMDKDALENAPEYMAD